MILILDSGQPTLSPITTFYKPFKGQNYRSGGLLLLSESAYCWRNDKTDKMECPKREHPSGLVNYWSLKHFEDRGKEGKYAAWLTRALCQTEWPSIEERKSAWGSAAYSIYIQKSLGSLQERPTPEDFSESGEAFLERIEELRPERVVMTSIVSWKSMPPTQLEHPRSTDGRCAAYRLADGTFVWCLAVPHQRARKMGWKRLGERIAEFVNEDLPRT